LVASTKVPEPKKSGSTVGEPNSGEPNSAVERVVGITNFIDAEDSVTDLVNFTKCPQHLALRAVDREAEDIRSILSRPTFMENLTWTAASATGTYLASYKVPTDILYYSGIKQAKINYNTFLNCTSVFRIEASPMQFQAGRLYMCYEPYYTGRGSRRVNATYLPQMTALHGISYDPAKPAPVELRIPFASIVSEYDLPMGQLEQGRLHLLVMSPLNSASTTGSVTVSVQAWLEDAELSVPTSKTYSSGPARSGAAVHSPDLAHGEPMQFQSSEAGMANKHVYSTALSRISRVATLLGHFPVLASVANPVAHFSNLASKVAAYFGFCKPPDVSAPTKITSHNRAPWTNGDGALPVVKLAQSCENAVDQTQSYFHNPIDEMDISYIVSNLVALNQWSWTTADAVGKMVTVIPVHPGLSTEVGTKGTYTFGSYTTTPLGFVSTMFKYWAGSIKYKLEAVSTPFHAGRLVVAYFPDYNPLAPLNITEIGNQYSVVWDISDSSELLFEVPYLNNVPYLNCFIDDQYNTALVNAETTGTGPRNRIRKVMNGAIVVFVLNQLVAPSAAADSVSIINWIGGGEDICFAEPTLGAYKPSAAFTPIRVDMTQKWYTGAAMTAPDWKSNPTRMEPIPEESEELVLQSAPSGLTVTGIDPYVTGTAQRNAFRNFIPAKKITPQERARLCQGEVITNLRPLIRRLTPAYEIYPQNVTNDGAWSGVAPNSNLALVLDPDYYGTGDGVGDASVYSKQIAPAVTGGANWITELESSIKYVSWLYCYARGSRVYGLSARPSNVINGASFTNLGDEIALPTDQGTFDFRLTTLNEEDTPPRQPYFRPEDELLGYNYANTTSGTLSASNYSYGFNSNLSGNMMVQKSGEAGSGLVVQVPPTSRYPFSLISNADQAEPAYIAFMKYVVPRCRRFLEIRFRAFTSSMSGTTANYRPKIWPFPLTIMEAAADDFSFGGLIPPPVITKVQKTIVFVDYNNGSRIAL